MARTFKFVLHFVGCVTVTVSPNQIIIIIIIIIILSFTIFRHSTFKISCHYFDPSDALIKLLKIDEPYLIQLFIQFMLIRTKDFQIFRFKNSRIIRKFLKGHHRSKEFDSPYAIIYSISVDTNSLIRFV